MNEQEEEVKPKWLLELENRKRKQHLGHETGAGAPCLSCESACPGLDLHFWRKICKNCKCRGDDHDFDDDEFPQFELLFGSNLKNKKKNKSVLLKVNDKKQAQSEAAFEWIPPDTTKELAADYMKALPSDKLPITGSPGAALRRQQLQKQLPLHDIDHKACDGLSEEERQEFDKYLNKLKTCAGQGRVSKLMTLRPFDPSLMTPANASDVQRFSPQHSQQLTKTTNNKDGGLNLRTPSSFIPKTSTQTNLRPPDHGPSVTGEFLHSRTPSFLANEEFAPRGVVAHNSSLQHFQAGIQPVTSSLDTIRTQQLQAISEENPRLGAYQIAAQLPGNLNSRPSTSAASAAPHELHYSKNPISLADEEQVMQVAAQRLSEPRTMLMARIEEQGVNPDRNQPESNALLAERMLSEALLPPSAINAGDIVGSSLDERGLMYIREKLNDKYNTSKSEPLLIANPSTSRELLERASSQQQHYHHPASVTSENIKRNPEIARDMVRSQTSSPEVDLESQSSSRPIRAELNRSMPVQANLIHSEQLDIPVFPDEPVGARLAQQNNPDEMSRLQDELQAMKMRNHTRQECKRCEDDIWPGDVVVTADKIKGAVWHPKCFKCCACNELLVDLVYFTYKGNLYCGRDLAKLLEIPRCHACDELIFVREYTVAEGQNYHVKHFCCWDCDIPLADHLYVMENDRPLCLPCYQKFYANTCNACGSAIAANQQGVAIKNLNFHATDSCFCCVTCKKSLLGGQVAIKENRLLCSKECIAEFLHRRAMGR